MTNDKSQLLNALRIDRAAQPATQRRSTWSAAIIGGAVAAALAGLTWLAVEQGALPAAMSSILPQQAQAVRVAVAHSLATGDAPAAGALLEATGYVVARRSATVGPKIAGKLSDVLIEEGMRVEVGQVIAHLDDSNAKAALAQAKATFDQAQTTGDDARPVFERNQIELAKGLIARAAFDTAKATFDQTQTALEVARATLAVAQQNEDDTVIVAPFAGVVTVKAAQAGEIISPQAAGAGFTRTGVATIVDMDSLEVDVDVNENFINRVRADQPATVTLNAYPDWQIPGHVIAVVPTADRSKATLPVRVAFDAKDPRILPELGARVAFLADGKKPKTAAPAGVSVPPEAIVSDGDQSAVFVVQDGRAERRAVMLGARTAKEQIVLSGVSGGESVAVAGVDKLTDGAKVKIEQ